MRQLSTMLDNHNWARRFSAIFVGVLLTGCAGATTPGAPAGAPAGAAGAGPETSATRASFTVAQAERGEDEFRGTCGECHSTGEFRGRTFLFRWRRQTAWDFFREIVTTMPEDAPGSLRDSEYADIISWVLQMNGYEAGDAELPATEVALDQFVMDGGTSP